MQITQQTVVDHSSRQKWAWLAPVVALVLGSAVAGWLDRLGAQSASLASVYLLAGVAGGYGWQLLFRRELAERFWIWAVLLTAAAFVGFIPGAELDDSVASVALAWLGVSAGAVLAEHWHRRTARISV